MELGESGNPCCLKFSNKWMYESTHSDFESDAYFDLIGFDWSQEEVDKCTSSEVPIKGQVKNTNSNVESLSVTTRNSVYPMEARCRRSKRKNVHCVRLFETKGMQSDKISSPSIASRGKQNVAKKPSKSQKPKYNKVHKHLLKNEFTKKDLITAVQHNVKAVEVVHPQNTKTEASGISALAGLSSSTSSKKFDHEFHSQAKIKVVYLCQYCRKVLDQKSKLINHIRSHTNERPFACISCGRDFRYKGNLVNHLCRVHGRAKAHVNNLMTGIETGTSRQFLVCCFCSKSFKDIKTIRSHIMTCHRELIKGNIRS